MSLYWSTDCITISIRAIHKLFQSLQQQKTSYDHLLYHDSDLSKNRELRCNAKLWINSTTVWATITAHLTYYDHLILGIAPQECRWVVRNPRINAFSTINQAWMDQIKYWCQICKNNQIKLTIPIYI